MHVTKAIGIPMLLAGLALSGAANAALVTRNFEWVGTTGLNGYNPGYSASGSFTYDDSFTTVAAEGTWTGNFNDGLESLTISFFDDVGGLLGTFGTVVGGVINYEYLVFQFNPLTQQITGNFDMGQDTGNINEYYLYGTVGGASQMVEADSGDWLNSTNPASFTVSAVPVPAAAWLFGSGLIGLVGAARRNSRAS